LTFAVGVALSPIPIIAVVPILSSPRGRVNGPAFLAGWVFGLAALGTVLLLIAGGADASSSGAPADWVSFVKLVLGVLLLVLAVRQWSGRPRGVSEPEPPAWLKAIDTFTPGKSAGMAALLAANPKNLVFIAGAAAAIAQTGADAGGQAVALAVFVLVATLGTGTPLAIYFFLGDRAEPILESLRGWMARESATIMAVLCVVIGAKLIGDAVSGLTS
jgi:Sap, sulfolipid-1-addressing protein